ncbi:MAG: 30S ribosomal protein S9 [Rickettsiales bacterium]|nr:30S ribosomal protein S9 [Rickettsiales bacterium]|tara:strand:- start:305 stop:763 length:459 start_codon:yes stop_codon:yes gene_type:complete
MSAKTEITSKPVELKSENSPKIDKLGRAYATGRRKESVSRVWIRRGSGKVIVNGKSSDKYFSRSVLRMLLEEPLKKTDRFSEIEVFSTVSGGGLSGQAGALRHGISRALVNFEPDLKEKLKKLGFLTRDARKVERKKYGRHKARKKPQFSKR